MKNVDDQGFTRVHQLRKKYPVRQNHAAPKRQNWYVPEFYGYCH